MAEHIDVVADDFRERARVHRDIAERLSAGPSAHGAVIAAVDALGPVFGDVRAAARELLEQRREYCRRQAEAHSDLADTLCHAADAWELNDAGASRRIRAVVQ